MLLENRLLLQQFKEGEPQAMTAVFNHYSDGLARYLLRGFGFSSGGRKLRFDGLRQRHDLHDVVAETFRRAFEERNRQAYSGLSAYEGYLQTIARNIVIDGLRSPSRNWVSLEEPAQPNGEQEHLHAEPADPGPTPERALEQAQCSELLEQFLAGLDPLQRRFVELRYRQSRSQEQIANTLHKSRRWVRSFEVKIRRQLVQHLRRSGYLPQGLTTTGRPR